VLLQKVAEMTVQSSLARAIHTQSMAGEGGAGVGDGDPAFFDQSILMKLCKFIRWCVPAGKTRLKLGSAVAVRGCFQRNIAA
jgi:hypothetical protein